MRWIYISPHLDDAVLSAGGLIYEQTRAGIPVEIWTCMAGFPPNEELSPFAERLHEAWGFASAAEAIRSRRAEDEQAASLVGAKTHHFDFLDCVYRRTADGEWEYPETVFDPPHENDALLLDKLGRAVAARLLPQDVLVCQFAVGSHVDHILVRRAVEMLNLPLYYDCDIPYLFNRSHAFEPGVTGMQETVHAVSEAGLRSWQEAALAYRSQISTLAESSESLMDSLQKYWASKQGLSLWRSKPKIMRRGPQSRKRLDSASES